MYEKAVRDGNDVVMCRKDSVVWSGGQIRHTVFPKTFWDEDNIRFVEHPVLLTRLSTGPWNKLIKRELFYQIWFAEDIHYYEDYQFVVKAFCLANSIGVVKQILYHYYPIHNGVTARISEVWLDIIPSLEQIVDFMVTNGFIDIFRPEMECFATFVTNRYPSVIRKDDATWELRKRFIRETQASLRKWFPQWKENPYYKNKERTCLPKDISRCYSETHLLLLVWLSRFVPKKLWNLCLLVDKKVAVLRREWRVRRETRHA